MERLNALSQIAKQYLDGNLCRLVMEYESKYDLHISLQYKDRYDAWFDYELVLHKKKKSVDFIKHDHCSCIECLHLKRVKEFEQALVDYLYTH